MFGSLRLQKYLKYFFQGNNLIKMDKIQGKKSANFDKIQGKKSANFDKIQGKKLVK
jgi:hypothetical protein